MIRTKRVWRTLGICVRAKTGHFLLHIVTPPPSDADHVQVVTGLAKGAWK